MLIRTSKIGEDVEKLEPSYFAGGNVNGAAATENRWFLKTLNIELPYYTAIPLLEIENRDTNSTEG